MARTVGELGVALLQWSAFWAAVWLPFVTLGLLASALVPNGGPTPWWLVPALLGANVAALAIGHAHGSPATPSTGDNVGPGDDGGPYARGD